MKGFVMKYDYDQDSIITELRNIGLKEGQTLFVHSSLGYLGIPKGGMKKEIVCETLLGAFATVLGSEGTLCLPSFTYSICRGEVFDPSTTPAPGMGMLSEYVISGFKGSFYRSADPIFSILCIGKDAKELSQCKSFECFGHDSFFDRLYKRNGVLVNINMDAGSTFIHYVEKSLDVPYRFDKEFSGMVTEGQLQKNETWTYFCRDLEKPEDDTQFEVWDKVAREAGIIRSATVGRGSILAMDCKDVFRVIKDELKVRADFLTVKCRDYSKNSTN